jgi:hypothetical protein
MRNDEQLIYTPANSRKRRAFMFAGIPAGFVLALTIVVALVGSAGAATARSAVAPSNTAPPTISGTPTQGQVLTATTGSWNGTTPITYTYRWERCDSTGGSCANISGAIAATYTLVSPDVGNTLRVAVTATNADGAKTSTSVPTAVVAAAAATTTTATTATTATTTTSTTPGCTTSGGTVPVANVSSPAHLSIDQFQVTPSPISYGTRSLTARFHVSACGGSAQGALVYVTAVPYGMFSIPAEAVTGSDGWASLNFTALAGFPVSPHQRLLVMFVRARKSGEDILGGVSARRLVSFKVTRG